MTNNEAISILEDIMKDIEIEQDSDYYINLCREAIETAVSALAGGPINVEITEIHLFAKPDDVKDIDFPGTSREDK